MESQSFLSNQNVFKVGQKQQNSHYTHSTWNFQFENKNNFKLSYSEICLSKGKIQKRQKLNIIYDLSTFCNIYLSMYKNEKLRVESLSVNVIDKE